MITFGITSQLIGLLVSTWLTSVLIFALYWFVIRQHKLGEAPKSRLMLLLELYYTSFNKLVDGFSNGGIKWAYPYLFTLFNFIIINSLTPWIGLESVPSTIMFTLPLALITFIVAFVVGIGTMGIIGFIRHRYSNPMEIILQFAPLISMSVRLFAATFAGAIIGNIPWIIIASMAGSSLDISSMTPILQALVLWGWKIIDTLLSLIQAFVFIALTVIFWVTETGPSWSSKERKKLKEEKNKIIGSSKKLSITTKTKTLKNPTNKNEVSSSVEKFIRRDDG